MATHVKFLSFTPITIGNLRPTPNVGEWEAISAALAADTSPRLEPTPTDLEGKELKIIASYRSAAMWVEGASRSHASGPRRRVGTATLAGLLRASRKRCC